MLLGSEPMEPHWCLLDAVVSRWKSQRTFYYYHREKRVLFFSAQLKECPFSSVTRKCITSPSTPQQSYSCTDTNKQEGITIKHSFWPTSKKIIHLLFSREVECTYGSEGELILSGSGPFVLQSHLIIWYVSLCSNMGTWLVLFWSIVLLNPDDAIQPRAQCYPFFLQTKDNILPQKGAKYQKYWAF